MRYAAFKKIADAAGVTFTINAENFEMVAPKGKIFKGNELHSYLEAELWEQSPRYPRAELYEYNAGIIKMGFQDCLDPDCDHCHEPKS